MEIFGILALACLFGLMASPLPGLAFERLAKSRLGQQFIAEIEASEKAESDRADASRRRVAALKAIADKVPGLHAKAAEADREYIALEAEFFARKAAITQKKADAVSEVFRLDHALWVIERQLSETAPPALDVFKRELDKMYDQTGNAQSAEYGLGWKEETPGWLTRVRSCATNREAVAKRIAAIRKGLARGCVEELRLVALDVPQLAKEIEEIRHSIPGESTLSEFAEVN